MKFHIRDPESNGVVVTNPPDIFKLVANATRKSATVLLSGRNLVASTVPCTSHEDTLRWSGIGKDFFDYEHGDITTETLRCNMSVRGLNVDIWTELDLINDFPFDPDRLAALYDHVRSHPRLRRVPEDFEFSILIHDHEATPIFTYSDGLLTLTDDAGPEHTLPGGFEAGESGPDPVPRLHFMS